MAQTLIPKVFVYSDEFEAIGAGRPWLLCPIRIAPREGTVVDVGHAIERSTPPHRRLVLAVWEGRGLDHDWCILTLAAQA
jgi:hypothetical protein